MDSIIDNESTVEEVIVGQQLRTDRALILELFKPFVVGLEERARAGDLATVEELYLEVVAQGQR